MRVLFPFTWFLFISIACGLVGAVAALPFGCVGWGPFASGVMAYFFIIMVNLLGEIRDAT